MALTNQILIISDLHLANGKNQDDFGTFQNTKNREERLIDFIEKFNPSKIYFNGDIFELWQVKMSDIVLAHPKILKFINNDSRVVKIIGNHDYSLGGTLKISLTTKNEKKILITHGFEHEKYLGNKIQRFFCWFIGKFETFFPNVDNIFSHKYYVKDIADKKVMDYAKKILNKGYDIVVCGHSHVSNLKYFGSKVYANSGYCQEGNLEGILIDMDDGTVKLVSDSVENL